MNLFLINFCHFFFLETENVSDKITIESRDGEELIRSATEDKRLVFLQIGPTKNDTSIKMY